MEARIERPTFAGDIGDQVAETYWRPWLGKRMGLQRVAPLPKKGKLNTEEVPMMLVPDARRRVTLPASFKAGQPVNIEPLEDGTYRLVPMVAIPENQLWAWRSDVQTSVETSLQEYHEGESVPLDSTKGAVFQRKLAEK
jgi:hypothetical protein